MVWVRLHDGNSIRNVNGPDKVETAVSLAEAMRLCVRGAVLGEEDTVIGPAGAVALAPTRTVLSTFVSIANPPELLCPAAGGPCIVDQHAVPGIGIRGAPRTRPVHITALSTFFILYPPPCIY
jgi:hypothetical protein